MTRTRTLVDLIAACRAWDDFRRALADLPQKQKGDAWALWAARTSWSWASLFWTSLGEQRFKASHSGCARQFFGTAQQDVARARELNWDRL